MLHVIADLGQGGAEMVLYRLVAATSGTVEHLVVSLRSHGDIGPMLAAHGVRVEALGLARGAFTPAAMRKLTTLVREFSPDIVQARLHHGNLVGSIAAVRVGVPIVWAIHATALGAVRDNWKTALVRSCCSLISHWVPAAIVFDSATSRRLHTRLGYSRRRSLVIDNGIELEHLRPDEHARSKQRTDWGITDGDILLGCVARWDPLKDHANLIAALQLLSARRPDIRCVLVGRGMDAANAELAVLMDRHGVRDRVILAGRMPDLSAVMNALDFHVLASRSESAPVCVVEAMACGTPCIVTDVGDAARLVGNTGWASAARSPQALADAVERAIAALNEDGRAALGNRCRARAERYFGLETMVDRYTGLWREHAR